MPWCPKCGAEYLRAFSCKCRGFCPSCSKRKSLDLAIFLEEELYDTRRVKLEHFHLFEWFPLTPGRFHTAEAQEMRHRAYDAMFQTEDGRSYFTPHGKASMLRGGIGAVRFHPRMVADEPHYFMSASSNGVCHEGFPVLIPRRFYGPLKRRLLKEGAVPVNLGGEMRYLQMDNPTFLGGNREIPQLYLHVDQVEVLPQPRSEVKGYTVSAAISFIGEFEQLEGIYTTYATFNPMFILILTPFVVSLWNYLHKKGKEPSTPAKIGLGMFISALAMMVMVVASVMGGNDDANNMSPMWLISTYFIITFGELCLSPMGLSFVSKVAPQRMRGLMMGGWFGATAVGNYLSGFIGGFYNKLTHAEFFGILTVLLLLSALMVKLLLPKLEHATRGT